VSRATGVAEDQAGPLPPFFPPDTVQLTSWADVTEGLRSIHLYEDPPVVQDILGRVLSFLDGPSHRLRRRSLNRLVTPYSLELLRREVDAVVRMAMSEMVRPSDEPGLHECDLIPLGHRIFVGFAARLIGLKGADSAETLDELRDLYLPLPLAHSVRYISEGKDEIIENALAAKRAYKERFFDPSLKAVEAEFERAHPPESEIHTLLEIMVNRADSAWADREQALKEPLAFLIGGIDTSTQSLAHAVRELGDWFEAHAEDRPLLADRTFVAAALEESLRLNPPNPHLSRTAAEDVVLASRTRIRKGQAVAINRRLSNRDRSAWGPDADQFNPRREPPGNLPHYGATFGGGPHMCIGMRFVVGIQREGGSHVEILRSLFESGVRVDPRRAAVRCSRSPGRPALSTPRQGFSRCPPKAIIEVSGWNRSSRQRVRQSTRRRPDERSS
jgi:cytochrome P450